MEATDTQDPTPDTTDLIEVSPGVLEPRPFIIDSRERAEWLLCKLANNAAAKARIKAQAAAMIAQLDTDTQNLQQRHGADLEAWAQSEVDKTNGKRKSVHTLQGTLAFRTSPARLVVSDTDAALVRAHAMHLTETTIATGAYLKAAKEAMETTGELLPGVELLDACEKFGITFKGGDDSDETGA